MSEMVERVEQAIRKILHAGGSTDSAAIAAIEAMREPTMAIVYAICGPFPITNGMDEYEAGKRAWQDAIDVALK